MNINYHQDDYLEFETDKKFDLVTMIFCDYCALSPEQRKLLLTKMNKFLKPEGQILIDVFSLSRFDSISEATSYYDGPHKLDR
ncbi:class I SAM-dependent methyltransferase [Endozoicomonas montiporae]|uniref:class I SAM-dependent methyltransferase n=1 Tax=Endozoicomonas montiporae TaxID=1027273 RepID=UPI003B83650A